MFIFSCTIKKNVICYGVLLISYDYLVFINNLEWYLL